MTYVGAGGRKELQEFEESRLLMQTKALVHEYRAWCSGKGRGPGHMRSTRGSAADWP